MTAFTTKTAKRLSGTIHVAPDKSISHRSLIFAALAEGESKIKNLLLGEDVLNTLTILNQLGVLTSHDAGTLKPQDTLTVRGVGLYGLKPAQQQTGGVTPPLQCGNSGTTMRLMLGLLAGQKFASTLTGDDSLNKRPMERIFTPLKNMGASFEVTEKNGARLITVSQTKPLAAIHYASPVASAQVKSAILLAALHADGVTTVTEPTLSRNHTEIMLKGMGADVTSQGATATLTPGKKLTPIQIEIPGDISSAAFFIVAALIVPDSELTIAGVNLNPTRTGILDVLLKMGAAIRIQNQREVAGELVGDLLVKYSKLKNISISGAIIPRLVDEIPILALAGACATGVMVVADAKELRVKETDRIKAICTELKKIGVNIAEQDDGFVINGDGRTTFAPRVAGVVFKSYGDHRMAMMEAVAGLVLTGPATIDDVDSVKTSFPDFFEILRALGVTPQDKLL